MEFETEFPSLVQKTTRTIKVVEPAILTTEQIKRRNHYKGKKWIELEAVTRKCIDKKRLEKIIDNLWIQHPATQSHKGHNGALLELKREVQ